MGESGLNAAAAPASTVAGRAFAASDTRFREVRLKLIRALFVVGSLLATAVATVPAQQPAPAVKHAGKLAGGKRRRGDKALLRGIVLSDAERANIQSVRAKYGRQMKTLRTGARTLSQNVRAARQRGDTAALRSARSSVHAQRQQVRALEQSERNDLRGALAPQNQAKFDANEKTLQARAARKTLRGRRLSNR